jgi:nanoRNase/pAp phosphatase (c-di-AMP/oligoRNAs hydrolase)
VVSELLDAGASIEDLEFRLERYTKEQMTVFAVLARNLTDSGKGYSYSYIENGEFKHDDPRASGGLKAACEIFTDQFIRNIENNFWGFIVYPEEVNGQKAYSVSFRSVGGHQDVSEFAGKLGGGGHKAAAGAKGIVAESALAAVERVQSLIDD